jgi:hypothetical protein
VRPKRFGPFLQQGIELDGSPAGFRQTPTFGAYNFQAGWIEPIGVLPWGIFRGTYVETQGNATLSPYFSDVGTIFNLKPIRFVEIGLGYNRLLFHYSLAGFQGTQLPEPDRWRTLDILRSDSLEAAGADVFTFHSNFTVDLARLQLHAGGFRSLWDVDVRDARDIFFEYRSGLLVRKRDRINSLYGQALLNLEPHLGFLGFMARGVEVRDQYWWTSQTGLSQHLLSAGFSGWRWGRNSGRLYRGLDALLGFWISHPQLDNRPWQERLHVSLIWTWNVQILNLTED